MKVNILLISLLLLSAHSNAATITSTTTGGDWATGSTWVGGSAPTSTDQAVIATTGGNSITFGAAATCAGLTINSGAILTIGAFALTVNGTTDISGTINITNATGTKAFNGDVTINSGGVWNESAAAVVTFGGSFTNDATTFTASSGVHTFSGGSKVLSGTTITSIGTATFTGAYTNSGTLTVPTLLTVTGVTLTNNATITASTTLSGTGGVTNGTNAVLNIGGTISITTLTASASGNIVNYTGAGQTAKVTTYDNLILSGSGVKTFATTPTVNAVLSMEGTATVTVSGAGVVTYGANATLQYNTATGRTVSSEEWIATFNGTGGVFIINTGTITLNAAKILGLNVPLTINNGSTLTPGTNLLTLGGDFINNGTLTSGTGGITIANTATSQNISGFTTTGTVSMTKTSGTATFTGNVNGAGFTINGTGGTLNLGSGLSHTFTGTWTRTNGTLDCGSSTLKIAGAVNGTGGTFTAGTGTVEYNGSGAQTVVALNYNNLTISGSRTTNSVTLINAGTIGISGTFSPTATFTSGNYIITSSTVDFNGNSSLTIPAFNFNNLTISGSRTTNTITLINGGSVGVAGTFSSTATFTSGGYDVTNNTVNINGAGAQNISSFTFNNITTSNGGTKSSTGDITVNGTFTVNTPTTFSPGTSNTVNGTGTLTGTGTVLVTRTAATADFVTQYPISNKTLTSLTVEYASTGSQTINALNYFHLKVSGARTTNSVTLENTATIRISANFTNTATFTTGGWISTGSTVEANASGAQALAPITFNNLTISGSGTKTFATTPTVNGILSMEGTTTAIITVTTGVVTYGANATLQYNTSSAFNASAEEWISSFAATGGVIIANTGVITMGAAKVFNANIPLTINNGSTLTTGTNLLTLGGDFINNGTLTSGTGGITIANTATSQNISGFTTTGTVSMTKTSGTATFTGNVNGAALTINGTGGTLNLGSGLTHTITGALTRTNGTLDCSSSTLNIGGAVTGTGGTFSAGTGTVNYNGAGAQTVVALNYNNLTISGSRTINSVTLINAGTIGISGTFSPTATFTGGNYITTGSTVDFNGNSSLTIPAFNFNNLAISGSRTTNTVTLINGGSVGVAGTFSSTATFTSGGYDVTNNTVNINGAGAQNISSFTFNNITTSNGGTKSSTGDITVNGTFTVNTPTTFSPGTSNTVNGTGTLTGTGTLLVTRTAATADFVTQYPISNKTLTSLTVEYASTGAQTINALNYFHLRVSGARTTNSVTLENTGTINISGNFTSTATFTTGGWISTGSTVNANASGAQALAPITFNNLTISGSGTKTFATTPTVNGILSMEGTTTAILTVTTGVVTYGANATLQYNTSSAFNASAEEWISPFAASGGVIIANTGAIIMGGIKVFNTDIPLTINNGSTLTPGANLLTLGGDFINNGTLTSGTGGITIANTATSQNISGFTTTGTVSMTKTAGTATINGNINANSLTYTGASNSTLFLNGYSVTLSAGITMPRPGTTITLNVGSGSLSCTTISLGGTTAGTRNTDITISSGTVTASGAITSAGVASRITFSSSGTLNVGGNFMNTTSGTFTPSTSTVNLYGAAQTSAPFLFYNLTLSGSGVKTFATTPTVNNVLSIEGTATVIVTTGVVAYGTNATLQYNTSTARTVSAEEWISPFTATGGVIIDNTGTITMDAAKQIGNNSSVPVEIKSGATLSTSTSNFGLTFHGNFINTGTLTAGSSAITMAGTVTSQNISGFTTTGTISMTKTSGTATFTGNVSGGSLTINGTGGTLNLGSGLSHSISGTWTRTAGTLDCGSSILNLGGTINGSGGTFNANTGTINYNSSGNQTIEPFTYYNLSTSTGGTKTINADITVTNYFTNNMGSVLSINPGKSLTVTNTVTNNAGNSGIVIRSDATGTGNLIHNNTGVQGTVQRYLTGHITYKPIHFISTPLTNGTIDSFWRNGDYNIYWYDESNPSTTLNTGWTRILGAGAALTKGRGYSVVSQYSNRTNNYLGNLTVPDDFTSQSIPVTYTTSTTPTPAVEGWNLIGNPYPCALNTTSFLTDNSTALDPSYAAIYYWNDVDGIKNHSQDYASRNLTGGIAASGAGIVPNDRISVGQGFFVKVSSSTSSISLASTQRTTNTSPQFFVIDPLQIQRLWLSVDGPNDLYNELLLGFEDGATNGIDPGYDAIKLRGNTDIALYSIMKDASQINTGYSNEFAIQTLPLVAQDDQVNIGFFAANTGSYTFRLKPTENFDPFVEVYLKDLATGTLTDLRKDSIYTLNINSGEYKNRFILQFHNNSPVGITQKKPPKTVDIYSADSKIYISGDVKVNDLVTITDLAGRVVCSYKIKAGTVNEINLEGKSGVYFVSVVTDHGVITKKLLCNIAR